MNIFYCLLFLLLFPSNVFASDNNYSIKLKGFPFDNVQWGSSPQALNINQKDLYCEQTESNEARCYLYLNMNARQAALTFTNNRWLSLSIRSKPTDFISEIAYINKSIGAESKGPIRTEGSEIYKWISLYQEYKLDCDKSTGECTLSVYPSLYTDILTRRPTKELFKLLDLTLGYSTSRDFIQIANSNKWELHLSKNEDFEIYNVSNIGIVGVSMVEFEFVDNKLKSITYHFETNKSAKDQLSMLKNKYGDPENNSELDEGWTWTKNKDTRDEITIHLGYGKSGEEIREISYVYEALSARKLQQIILKSTETMKK